MIWFSHFVNQWFLVPIILKCSVIFFFFFNICHKNHCEWFYRFSFFLFPNLLSAQNKNPVTHGRKLLISWIPASTEFWKRRMHFLKFWISFWKKKKLTTWFLFWWCQLCPWIYLSINFEAVILDSNNLHTSRFYCISVCVQDLVYKLALLLLSSEHQNSPALRPSKRTICPAHLSSTSGLPSL